MAVSSSLSCCWGDVQDTGVANEGRGLDRQAEVVHHCAVLVCVGECGGYSGVKISPLTNLRGELNPVKFVG